MSTGSPQLLELFLWVRYRDALWFHYWNQLLDRIAQMFYGRQLVDAMDLVSGGIIVCAKLLLNFTTDYAAKCWNLIQTKSFIVSVVYCKNDPVPYNCGYKWGVGVCNNVSQNRQCTQYIYNINNTLFCRWLLKLACISAIKSHWSLIIIHFCNVTLVESIKRNLWKRHQNFSGLHLFF